VKENPSHSTEKERKIPYVYVPISGSLYSLPSRKGFSDGVVWGEEKENDECAMMNDKLKTPALFNSSLRRHHSN
jgi:hypothetical protein